MLYLTTGANGAGKTLFTLRDVRALQEKTGRPVAHNGRFEMVADFGWKTIDAKDWQKEPDGTIFLFDEAHNDFPLRGTGAAVPEHVKMLAEHRRRGFDFFLITQHPMNIDAFVRRLIGPPGWHRHVKNTFGVDMATIATYSAANPNCEKTGASESGEITTVAYPKEVYAWYRSASLHTRQRKIPKMVYVLVAGLAVSIGGAWYGMTSIFGLSDGAVPQQAAKPPAQQQGTTASRAGDGPSSTRPGRPPMTAQEYVASFTPRVEGLAYTAPRYDGATTPREAPYPAACVQAGDKCRCYTQQATRLDVPKGLCLQIVEKGFFVDWRVQQQAPGRPPAGPPGAPGVTAVPTPAAIPAPAPAAPAGPAVPPAATVAAAQ